MELNEAFEIAADMISDSWDCVYVEGDIEDTIIDYIKLREDVKITLLKNMGFEPIEYDADMFETVYNFLSIIAYFKDSDGIMYLLQGDSFEIEPVKLNQTDKEREEYINELILKKFNSVKLLKEVAEELEYIDTNYHTLYEEERK